MLRGPLLRLLATTVAAAALAGAAGCGGGSSADDAPAPLDATPVTKTDDSMQAPDGARVVLLPPSDARRTVEVPGCSRQPPNRLEVAGAALPRIVVIEPCAGTGAGSVVVDAPDPDALGAAGPAGLVEAPRDTRGRMLVVPACTPGEGDIGTGRVPAEARGNTLEAPGCTVANLPADAALPVSLGSRAVRLAPAATRRTIGVPACAQTTGGRAWDRGAPNDVTVTTDRDTRTLVVGPCPMEDGRTTDAAGAGVLVLAPGAAMPQAGADPAGTLTVPAATRPSRVEIPGCTLPNDGRAVIGVGNFTLTRPAAPPCQVPGIGFQSVGGEPGGAGGGGEEGGGQGGNPPS